MNPGLTTEKGHSVLLAKRKGNNFSKLKKYTTPYKNVSSFDREKFYNEKYGTRLKKVGRWALVFINVTFNSACHIH